MGIDPLNWLFTLSNGILLSVLLVLWLGIETGILLFANPSYLLDSFGQGEKHTVKEVESYASKALTFASLTFAGLTFVLAQFRESNPEIIGNTVYLFTVGFGLFILSYKLEVYGAFRRIYFSMQQRLFNFGVLSLVFGLALFFYEFSTGLSVPIILITVLIVALHLKEYRDDYEDYVSGEPSATMTDEENIRILVIRALDAHSVDAREVDVVADDNGEYEVEVAFDGELLLGDAQEDLLQANEGEVAWCGVRDGRLLLAVQLE